MANQKDARYNTSKDAKATTNGKGSRSKGKTPYRGKQGRKDNGSKRVNLDNERESKFEKQYNRDSKRSTANDVAWYSKNPELLKAAASIPFASVLGKPVGEWSGRVPGVMVFDYAPAIGESQIATSSNYNSEFGPYAINQAGRQIYSYLVHANSRNYKYAYQDVMILCLAGSQVFSMLASMVRAYGLVKVYSETNAYLPKAVLQSLGFQVDDLRNNLGNMWFEINEMISRSNQIWIPNTMPLIQRWFWLNSMVFTDDEDPKGQIYVFNQNNYWKYTETAFQSGGALVRLTMKDTSGHVVGEEFKPSANKSYTWSQWKEAFNIMIQALLDSEDRGIIFGDILNAFGADKIYSMHEVAADYKVFPAYNAEVLTQIENLTVAQGIIQEAVVQFHGTSTNQKQVLAPRYTVIPDPTANAKWLNGMVPDVAVINFHQPNQPTPEQIVVATRMQSMGVANFANVPVMAVSSGGSWNPIESQQPVVRTCGSEIVNDAHVVCAKRSGSGGQTTFEVIDVKFNTIGTASGTAAFPDSPNQVQQAAYASAFDWHPFVYSMQSNIGTKTTWTGVPTQCFALDYDSIPLGDYSNYSTIDTVMADKMHSMSLFSEFGLPYI